MFTENYHPHGIPKTGEPTVSWMTNSGLIAIPESEAKMRRDAMAAQLGVAKLLAEMEEMRKTIKKLETELVEVSNYVLMLSDYAKIAYVKRGADD